MTTKYSLINEITADKILAANFVAGTNRPDGFLKFIWIKFRYDLLRWLLSLTYLTYDFNQIELKDVCNFKDWCNGYILYSTN